MIIFALALVLSIAALADAIAHGAYFAVAAITLSLHGILTVVFRTSA